MATTTADVEVRIFGNVRDFAKAMNDAKLQTMNFQQKLLAASGVMKSWGRSMTLGVTLPVVAGLALATKAALDDAKSQEVLRKQILNVTTATDAEIAGVEKWINAQSRATGVLDDELRPALGRIVAATGDLKRSEELLATAQNVAAGTGKSLDSVITAIIKGTQGSTTGFQRMGIATKNAAGQALTFDEILASLQKKFDGMAKTKATPFEKLKVAMSEAGETIGRVLLPYVEKAADALVWLAEKFEAMPGWTKPVAVGIGVVVAAIGPLLWMIGAAAQGFRDVRAAIKVVLGLLKVGPWAAETAAIEANTIALQANNAARAQSMPGGAQPLQPIGTPTGKWGGWGKLLFTGGMAAAGVGAAMAVVDLNAKQMRELEDQIPKWQRMRDQYEAIARQIEAIDPSVPGAEDKLERLRGELGRLGDALKNSTAGAKTQLASDINATIEKVDQLKGSFKQATVAAEEMANKMVTLAGSLNQIPAALAWMYGIDPETGKFIGPEGRIPGYQAPTSTQPTGSTYTIERLDSGGIVKAKPGGRIVNLAEGGEDEYVIPKSKLAREIGGSPVHVHIGTLVGTDERAARQLADMVGRHLMRGVMRKMVGVNA